jgi:uncharacterized delta-60 repeat protein
MGYRRKKQPLVFVWSVLFLIFMLPQTIWGQVPQRINFQGYVTDPDGNPVPDGDYDMVFAIYDVDTAGTALWSEAQTVVVINGIYNVQIGVTTDSAEPNPFPTDLFQGTRYLGITIAPDSDEMMPRQLLTSTPFAMRAEVADAVADDAISTYHIADGSVTVDDLDTASVDAHYVNEGQANSITAAMIQDGSGSELDADTVDGLDSTDFATATHSHSDMYTKAQVDALLAALEARLNNVEIGMPPVPANLTATAVSWNEIRLDWTHMSYFETGFYVERSLDGTNFSQITSVAADTVSFTDFALLPFTTYYYRIKAFNSVNETAYSNIASAVTEDTTEIVGRIDTAFGSGGVAVYNNPNGGTFGNDKGQAITLDSSGRILIAGYSYNTSNNSDMALWRYTPSGALDTNFGTGGVVIHDNAAGGSSYDYGNAVAVDANGKILVAGSSMAATGSADMVIWRFNDDGTPDTTFDTDGILVDVRENDDSGNAIAIDSNGKIVVAGHTRTSTYDMTIWRYNSGGTPDTTFGTDGVAINLTSGVSEFGYSMALDANGKILVAGRGPGDGVGADMTIWRHNADGTLDTTFDTDGIVTHSNAAGGDNFDCGNAIAVDSFGKILVAGHSLNNVGNDDHVVWRYNADGTLDTTFDTDGFVTFKVAVGGYDQSYGMILDSSERILVTGVSQDSTGDYDMVLWRFNPDGSLDTTFDQDGFLLHDSAGGGFNAYDQGSSIALDTSGRILVTGMSNKNMVIWRFK